MWGFVVPESRLAVVMATDIVGFTALVESGAEQALERLERSHDLLRTVVAEHGGQWLEDAGDRTLSAFSSPIHAVACALQVQRRMGEETALELRIGVAQGGMLLTRNHAYGESINAASLIERLGDPGGLVVTKPVYEAVRGELAVDFVAMGEKVLSGMSVPIKLYAVTGERRANALSRMTQGMIRRRIPHFLGAYLALGWAIIEVGDWMVEKGLFDQAWVYGLGAALLMLIPSVMLVAYTHGAHGKDRLTTSEKILVPTNLLAAGLVAFMLVARVEAPPPALVTDAKPESIAVLPFINLSDNSEADYFSRGLAEELIHRLARVPELRIASRSSSFALGRQDLDPREISRRLGVGTILEGSVRRQGNRVRVTAQLIDVFENSPLWSEQYDRELVDIFAIQDDIAGQVVLELMGVLQPEVMASFERARASSLSAYDAYLRGLDLLHQPTSESTLEGARQQFDQALEEDPQFGAAHAAMCELNLAQYELSRSPALIDSAQNACRRALELDADLLDVRLALGTLHRYKGELQAAAQAFEQLLQRRPSARAWVGLGRTHAALGNWEEAERSLQNAIAFDPGDWSHRLAMAEFLYQQGRFEEALDQLASVVEDSPDNARAYLLMGASHDYLGNLQASLRATQRSIELTPSRAGYRDLGLTHYYLGDYDRAVVAFRKAIDLGPDDYASWGSLGHAYLFLDGHDEAARASFERASQLARDLLERNPGDWLTLAKLAEYTLQLGAASQARSMIDQALAGGAHISEVHFHDAIIHAELGQYEKALDALERAVDLGSPATMIANDPQLGELKNKPRFRDLMRRPKGEGI